MKFILFLLTASLAVALSSPLAEEEYQLLFTKFVSQHNKQYQDVDEFFSRFNVFKSNMDIIVKHQLKEGRTYELAMNQFGDLTADEFKAIYLNYVHEPRSNDKAAPLKNNVALPDSVDWTTQGAVTPVKNQGQCGSCWAFSTTGSIEGIHAISTGNLVSLSEQELVDCAGSAGNQGCNGGSMPAAMGWVTSNGGLCTESDYPYTAKGGTCQSSSCTSATTISSHQEVEASNSDALQTALAQQPVSVAVDAGGSVWQFYSGGVVSSACGTQLDHGVLAVGYGTDGGQGYWKVKNSWGASWGESGYIRLLRTPGATDAGECGILLSASYPVA